MTVKQLDSTMVDDFNSLRHFGVKGMHWGVRHTREELLAKAGQHESAAAEHTKLALKYEAEHQELQNMGTNSAAFKRVYGEYSKNQTDREFFRQNGQSKAQALQQTDTNLRIIHNYHARNANGHTKRAAKLRAKAEGMEHGAIVRLPYYEAAEDFLMHFGIKGMHWGVRNGRETGPPSSDAAEAAAAHEKARSGGGTHVLTNKELESLTKRLNLEQQYARLSNPPGPSNVKKGKDFVGDIIGVGKMGVDAYETGKKIAKIVDDVTKEKKK